MAGQVTAEYVEVLVAPPSRVTAEYVEVLVGAPHGSQVTAEYVEVAVVAPIVPPPPVVTRRPPIKVEIAFGSQPMGETPVWTDVTPYVWAERGLTVTRGRQFELDRIEAGTLALTFEDTDRRFDPLNTASPYAPNVLPNKRIRVRALTPDDTNAVGLFEGFVEGWPPAWEGAGNSSTIFNVKASDGLAYLARAALPGSVWETAIRALNPRLWWRFFEQAGSTIYDHSGQHTLLPGVLEGGAKLGEPGLLVKGDPLDGAVSFPVDATGRHQGRIRLAKTAANNVFTGLFTVVVPFSLPHDTPVGGFLWTMGYSGARYENGPGLVFALSQAGSPSSEVRTTKPVADDQMHLLVCVYGGTAATQKLYLDGVDVTEPYVGPAYVTPDLDALAVGSNLPGFDEGWPGTIDDFVVLPGALTAAQVAGLWSAASAPWANDTAGVRIGRLLDAVGWPASRRRLDSGVSLLQPTELGGMALDRVQQAATDDGGMVFVDGNGNLVFYDRRHKSTAVNAAIFGDSGVELEYEDLQPSYDRTQIRNLIQLTVDSLGVAEERDATSIATYGTCGYQETIRVASLDDAHDRARWLLGQYKDPAVRFDQLAVHPLDRTSDAALWAQVLERELGDRLSVRRRVPPDAALHALDAYLEHVEHRITPDDWLTTWELSPAFGWDFWILGDPAKGVLETTAKLGW